MPSSVRAAVAAAVLLLSVLSACGSDGAAPSTPGPWAAVAAGEAHTLALRKDGTLWAFGANDAGQLGDGSLADRFAPVPVGAHASWQTLAAGGGHSAALTRDGVLHLWGANAGGQLGDGTRTPHPEPTALPTTARFVAVSAGSSHTAAIRADGTLFTWGRNGYGQVGDPASTGDHLEPFNVGSGARWTAVAAGGLHTVALRADGTLWAWGSNFDGQLGLGAGAASRLYEPAAIPTTARWRAVAAGRLHTVALREDGTLWAWGTNSDGQLGLGGATQGELAPVQVAPRDRWIAVAAGATHSLALRSDGTLWAWGSNADGELGRGEVIYTRDPNPDRVAGATAIAALSAGTSFSAVVGADGSLWAWGSGFRGQLGHGGAGIAENHPSPAPVGAFAVVAARDAGAAAIAADGSLWSWGSDVSQAVGNGSGSQDDVGAPVRLGAATDWSALSGGAYHTVGLRAGGVAAGFGDNQLGQLGGGGMLWPEPGQLPTTARFTALAAGALHTLALRDDGTVWAAGSDLFGQLGGGPAGLRAYVPVATAGVFVAVAAGGYHSLAIRQDGTLWAWGNNVEGQLGIGSMDPERTTPAQVGTASDWVRIAAGRFHSLGVRADGSLWAWGGNTTGAVGDGSLTSAVRSPVRVGSASDWSEVAAGGFHSLGRRATGLYAWGLNVAGQLGDGTRVSRNAPVQIGAETTWGRLAGGYSSSYAIREGTLYAWGENAYGQLGTGTPGRAHDRWAPARVP